MPTILQLKIKIKIKRCNHPGQESFRGLARPQAEDVRRVKRGR